MRKLWRGLLSTALALTMSVSLFGCGSNESKEKNDDAKESVIEFNSINLDEDYKDIKADIKVITQRTDLIDNVFKDYITEFQKLYPNINVKYEGITNYADDMTTRLSTKDWGDVCMIPTTIDKGELENHFVSFGKQDELQKDYVMLNNYSYKNNTYGIPSVGNAQGIVYNKKVFADAGITELPKTPDEFIDALTQIKEKTDSIPLYSNFHAGWTMTAWDAYITGSATGDPDFVNNGLLHGKNPFSKKDDMTGPYAVYYVLYEATANNLIEEDPTTSDWEACKSMINEGKIGAMVLGSWAVVQMQQAGPNADDIGYMSFPITVDGKQYASAGPDYCFGINKDISDDNQIASMLYVKWLTDKSNFAFDQGGIPPQVGAEYPEALSAFSDIELVVNSAPISGEEELYNNVNNDSEIGIDTDQTPDCNILENALNREQTLDEIMDEWNEKWTQAQKDNDVEIYE